MAKDEDVLTATTGAILREIIETERERDVTGGFQPGIAERLARLYAELDFRLPIPYRGGRP